MAKGPMSEETKAKIKEAHRIRREKIAKPVEEAIQIDDGDYAPQPAARTPLRAGRQEVRGRDGEVLSRKRTHAGDIFALPTDLIPTGWAYQWNAVSVTGNTEVLLDQNLMMAENGWRPVPADRYPGRFMPVGHKGSIIRGGLRLDERPEQLSIEAHNEDVRNAKQLISDRNESLKLGKVKQSMPDGFEMNGKYRGTGGGIRMEIDKSLDVLSVPRPQHKIAGAND